MTTFLVWILKAAVALNLHLLVTVPLAALVLRALRPAPGMRALAWAGVLAGAALPAMHPGTAEVPLLEDVVGPGVLSVGAGPLGGGSAPVLLQATLEMRQQVFTGGDAVATLLGPTWAPVLGGLVLLLGLLGTLRLLAGYRALARRLAGMRGRGAWKGIPVLEGEGMPGPFAFGTVRPCIVVPGSVRRACSPEELEAVLAHEEAHVRRGDPTWFLALAVAEHLGAAVPLVRQVGRQIRAASEEAADRRALAGRGRRALGEALVKCASLQAGRPLPAVPASSREGLRRRLDALYRPAPAAGPSWAAVVATVAVALGTRVF